MKRLNLSYAKLFQLATNVKNSMERDWTVFEAAGITNEQFDVFKGNLVELGSDFDQLYELPKVQLSAQKQEKEEELRAKLRQIFLLLNRAFKLKNGNTGLRIDAVSRYGQDTIFHVAKMAVGVMRANLSLLSGYNINDDYINEFDIFVNEYLDVKIQRDAAIQLRDIATRKRNQKAEEVYNDLSFFAQMGKAIFANTDEARYNDYILGINSGSNEAEALEDFIDEETPPDTSDVIESSEIIEEPVVSDF